MNDDNKFLQAEDDGLPFRESNEYARYKLRALAHYIGQTNTALRERPWRDRYYIDLQAGPGKNRIGGQIVLGSPLIALTAQHPFTQYRLNELDEGNKQALERRVSASPLANITRIYNEDANHVVHKICTEIDARDRVFLDGMYPSLNLAFLDPEGLELEWTTVARLAQINRMDLIINFSTSGINRNIGAGNYEIIDRFFGNQNWRQHAQIGDSVQRRRKLIDEYLGQLKVFGYYIDVDPDLGSHDVSFRNSRNSEVYSLIFASKHPLGDKFWRRATVKPDQPKLL